jgi:Arc/MetJ-type ribon-helix-helix transcriptional regulator
MTIKLPPAVENSLRDAVLGGEFASLDDAMTQAAGLLLERLRSRHQSSGALANPPVLATPAAARETKDAGPHQPIWEVFEEIAASIPEAEWSKLPADGAEQHDHYIYGTPKRLVP